MLISMHSLLFQRTEGHTVSAVLLQMRGSQPGPGRISAWPRHQSEICFVQIVLHYTCPPAPAPADTCTSSYTGGHKERPLLFFYDDIFSSEYQEKKWRHLSCPWAIRCIVWIVLIAIPCSFQIAEFRDVCTKKFLRKKCPTFLLPLLYIYIYTHRILDVCEILLILSCVVTCFVSNLLFSFTVSAWGCRAGYWGWKSGIV